MTTLEHSTDLTTSPAQGRLARRKARTSAAILDAATRLFTEQGYDATSIQQVAQESNIGVGTLYGYFDSKAHLFRAVLTRQWNTALDQYVATVDTSAPILDQAVAAVNALAEYIRADRRLLRAAFALRDEFPKEDAVFAGQILGKLARLIERGIAEGSIGPVPAHATAGVLMSSTVLAMLHIGPWHHNPDDDQTIHDLEHLARRLLRP
jgi:AcrR family transcriptional regulator